MQTGAMTRIQTSHRPLLFALFVLSGWMIFLLGNNYNSLFPTNESTLYKWAITLLFLAAAAILRLSEGLRMYWESAYALFIAAFANILNWDLGNLLADWLPAPASTAGELAIDKLSQCLPVVLAIILLTLVVGKDLGSIFLKKGDLRWGLRFGLVSFGVFAAIFAVIAVLQASAPPSHGLTATGVPLKTILAAIPSILVFCFTNSLMEELWFRGIFLKELSTFLGPTAAVVATALVFGSVHLGATYIIPIQMVVFPLIAFALGLVNGFVMLKTDSIWGSVFFHAGYDLRVIIPILVSM